MTKGDNPVSEINAWAMRDGIKLGLVGVATMAMWRTSVVQGWGSVLFILLLLSGPVVGVGLTRGFSRYVVDRTGSFSFTHGFMHSLFTGFYASVWVALAIYLYLHYFDHGMVFAAMAQQFYTPESARLFQSDPQLRVMLDTLSGGRGAAGIAETFSRIGDATYAVMPIYGALFISPLVAIVSGIVCQRRKPGQGGPEA